MSGHIKIKKYDTSLEKHDHLRIIFENNVSMIYNDPRRFEALLIF